MRVASPPGACCEPPTVLQVQFAEITQTYLLSFPPLWLPSVQIDLYAVVMGYPSLQLQNIVDEWSFGLITFVHSFCQVLLKTDTRSACKSRWTGVVSVPATFTFLGCILLHIGLADEMHFSIV